MNHPAIDCDNLIIGAGLAGSLLAWQLQQAGQSIHIIHQPSLTSASRVAAGLINPVTGQRLVLQNNIETILPAATKLYAQLCQYFKQPFFIAKPMLRSLYNERLQKAWQKRRIDSAYQPYLSEIKHDKYRILQLQTGYLNTNALLNALHAKFKQHAQISAAKFQYQDLNISEKHIQWQNISALRIIFCQGWRGLNCNLFSFLPFQPAKGEILHLTSSKKLPEHIINQQKWLLPLDGFHCKVGATYDTQNLNEVCTQQARQDLWQALEKFSIAPENMQITDQQAGIRPNTLDKQPFLGTHAHHPRVHIFNGFGSKGSMLIPYYAQVMSDYLNTGKPLPKYADIARFTCA